DGIADCLDDDWDNDGSKNVDDCQPRNPAVHPGATDICNGIDDDCDRLTDNGEAAGCGCYVCAGVEGCLTACDSNDDVDPGFVCDSSDFDHDENTHECLPSVCGNEVVEAGEVCDDGDNIGAYGGCFACQELGPFCGDGRRQFEFELCDDGELNGTHGHCNNTCDGPTPPECGDGFPEGTEQCDLGDGNSDAPNATCRTDCTLRRCGDGIADPQFDEQCDAGPGGGATTCGCSKTCVFPSEGVVCRNVAGQCDVAESCDGAGHCPTDAKLQGVQCRGADLVCDVAEVCDGVSNDCPADAKAPSTKVCRAAEGLCDVAEKCDGTNKTCPSDKVLPVDTECRASAGDCDSAEKCDGESAACPDDSFFGHDKACRESVGDCDVTEFCEGNSTVCPDDVVLFEGTVCHESMGGCDQNVTCNGLDGVCDYAGVEPLGTVCRGAIADCDAEEQCDGVSADCPIDFWDDNTTVCRGAAGVCDQPESCTGFSPFCPEDSFFGFGTTCRDSVGGCDFPEYCEGNSTECPKDQVAFEGYVCHSAEGDCDQNVTCNGVDGACDYTGYLAEGTVCRGQNGDCDAEEKCPGGSGQCPPDLFADNTTVCRGSQGVCDLVELCTGFDRYCPFDDVADNTTVCNAGNGFCNPEEHCSGDGYDCQPDVVQEDGTNCTDTQDCTSSSCVCETGTCVDACGNGRIDGDEACDDGDLNGQRNHCNVTCDAPCAVDSSWVRKGGGFGSDGSEAVAVDEDGASYTTGFYGGGQLAAVPQAPSFGSVEFGANQFSYQGNDDVFVMATSNDNVPTWAACAGGFNDDESTGVAVDQTGVTVAGYFASQITFGCCDAQLNIPNAGAIGGECPTLFSSNETGDNEVFVARYVKATGELLWVDSGGSYDDDYAYGVAATPTGDSVVVGESTCAARPASTSAPRAPTCSAAATPRWSATTSTATCAGSTPSAAPTMTGRRRSRSTAPATRSCWAASPARRSSAPPISPGPSTAAATCSWRASTTPAR
ncbi:MAG: MopE-related protein, partial [Myxococcota bacterium]